jgi:capsular exopolysaccharide synthesis family protein
VPPANAGKPDPTRQRPEPRPTLGPVPQPPPREATPPRPVPHPPAPAAASGPDLTALLSAMRRRWMIALSLGIIAAVAAATAAYLLVSPNYTIFAQVHVSADTNVFGRTNMNPGEFSRFRRTQAARMKSRSVLIAALKRDEVKLLTIVREQSDPLLWLENELLVETPEDTEIVSLTMKCSGDPDPYITLIQGIYQAFLKELNEEEPRIKGQRLAELDKIIVAKNASLKSKRDQWKAEAERIGNPDSEGIKQKLTILSLTVSNLNAQYNQAERDLRLAKVRLEGHKAGIKELTNPPVQPALLNEALDSDPKYKDFLKRITNLDQTIKTYRKYHPDSNDTQLKQMLENREQYKQEIEDHRKEVRAEVAKRVREKAALDYQVELKRLESEYTIAADTESVVGQKLKTLSTELAALGKSSTDLEMLRDDIRVEAAAIEKLSSEKSGLEVELRSPLRINPFQDAGIQKKDIKRWLAALIGLPLVAFGAVCFGVAWLECRARRVQSCDEVAHGLGMRIIGSVPALTKAAQQPIGEDESYEHELLESIDAIRTLLLRDARLEDTRAIMVTSAVSGEAKTTLASHLATSLARAGRRTLLMDCDLRRPAAHQLFELPLAPGFSEVLMNEIHVAEAIRSTTVDGLWLMSAGQWDRQVMQALARGGGEEIFAKLRNEYDFIIVDSHPVLPATDSLLIGQHVDAVLISLLRDVSQMPRVQTAGERLHALGIRILGAVVNGMKPEDYGVGYQYATQATRAA